MVSATDIDGALATLRAKLEWAETQVVVYFSGEQAAAATRSLTQAQKGYAWLSGEGRTLVLSGEIPFAQWKVGAEGVADLLAELQAFDDRNSFSATLLDIAARSGERLKSVGLPIAAYVLAVLVLLVILKVR